MRGVLVVFQFSTCILLMIGTLIVSGQIHYLLHKDLGFEKAQVLLIQGGSLLGNQSASFKNELSRLAGVSHVSIGDYIPVEGGNRNGNTFGIEGGPPSDVQQPGQFWQVDGDYLPTMGIRLLEGRNFDPEQSGDSDAAIVNRRMVETLGLEQALGQRIHNGRSWTIIGVVDDFHFESMKEEIGPLCMVLGNSPSVIAVKFEGVRVGDLLQSVTGVWNTFSPGQPIRYTFLDETYRRMYDEVRRIGSILGCFTLLALFVACLGLYALSAFLTEQRSKEISVRRVVGASWGNILGLLSMNFVKLILVAFLIASPLAWYLMQQWLETFVYRIKLNPLVFIATGLVSLAIALVTISYQSFRAAHLDPVKGLRYE